MKVILIILLTFSLNLIGSEAETYTQQKKDFKLKLLAEAHAKTRSDKFYLDWDTFTATVNVNCGLITHLVQNHSKVTSVHFGNGSYYISIAPKIDSFVDLYEACERKGYSFKLITE